MFQIPSSTTPQVVIGAGSVLTPEDVEEANQAGATLIISPDTNPDVIKKTVSLDMVSAPGFSTPTEAFTALQHDADVVKLFPSIESVSPTIIKALLAVYPLSSKRCNTKIVAVGGVGTSVETMRGLWDAGCAGFGLGTALYRPGASKEEVAEKAGQAVRAIEELRREGMATYVSAIDELETTSLRLRLIRERLSVFGISCSDSV